MEGKILADKSVVADLKDFWKFCTISVDGNRIIVSDKKLPVYCLNELDIRDVTVKVDEQGILRVKGLKAQWEFCWYDTNIYQYDKDFEKFDERSIKTKKKVIGGLFRSKEERIVRYVEGRSWNLLKERIPFEKYYYGSWTLEIR